MCILEGRKAKCSPLVVPGTHQAGEASPHTRAKGPIVGTRTASAALSFGRRQRCVTWRINSANVPSGPHPRETPPAPRLPVVGLILPQEAPVHTWGSLVPQWGVSWHCPQGQHPERSLLLFR